MENKYELLAGINVNQHVEKKANLSYLSWAWAVDQVMRKDQEAHWVFREPIVYSDGTMMVHCDVTVFGKSLYMFLPVMDHRNKAIQNPNAFDVNKAMMRCLTKGLAVHGLGLYIYAGEDLPEEEKQNIIAEQKKSELQQSYEQALVFINSCTDSIKLDKVVNRFKSTEYAELINNACERRKAEITG